MEVLCYFGTGVGTAIIVTTATTVADNVVTVADQPIPDNSITVVAVITVVVTTVVVVTIFNQKQKCFWLHIPRLT